MVITVFFPNIVAIQSNCIMTVTFNLDISLGHNAKKSCLMDGFGRACRVADRIRSFSTSIQVSVKKWRSYSDRVFANVVD